MVLFSCADTLTNDLHDYICNFQPTLLCFDKVFPHDDSSLKIYVTVLY
jgi:hypothetical protein